MQLLKNHHTKKDKNNSKLHEDNPTNKKLREIAEFYAKHKAASGVNSFSAFASNKMETLQRLEYFILYLLSLQTSFLTFCISTFLFILNLILVHFILLFFLPLVLVFLSFFYRIIFHSCFTLSSFFTMVRIIRFLLYAFLRLFD